MHPLSVFAAASPRVVIVPARPLEPDRPHRLGPLGRFVRDHARVQGETAEGVRTRSQRGGTIVTRRRTQRWRPGPGVSVDQRTRVRRRAGGGSDAQAGRGAMSRPSRHTKRRAWPVGVTATIHNRRCARWLFISSSRRRLSSRCHD
ncbi:protein of unknown function [Methylorubrum extorquens DM4]|uniref:Uncharacterized protein n=1 Tax=Methylorubrum extorquens (strain DSM 6343 / CIP 106787 / DM4) TaxID=661410 RepID=C7CII1_METED|nr:protein of unknown function [Methylorubrum extorquens DM4]